MEIAKCKLKDNVLPTINSAMQFGIATIGVCTLVGAVLLTGVINNAVSGLCVGMSLVCWFAAMKANGGVLLGLLATCGWLFVAAVIATAFQ